MQSRWSAGGGDVRENYWGRGFRNSFFKNKQDNQGKKQPAIQRARGSSSHTEETARIGARRGGEAQSFLRTEGKPTQLGYSERTEGQTWIGERRGPDYKEALVDSGKGVDYLWRLREPKQGLSSRISWYICAFRLFWQLWTEKIEERQE